MLHCDEMSSIAHRAFPLADEFLVPLTGTPSWEIFDQSTVECYAMPWLSEISK